MSSVLLNECDRRASKLLQSQLQTQHSVRARQRSKKSLRQLRSFNEPVSVQGDASAG
ncbi:hypothetical protein L914_15771 [Phytophthora nicotianae]|uniref:Uncharacterized protein n=3 Tax=Phytophthora nicotianae TaxID=4792 RepID=V9EEP5_PHYNI|nr:hypothetical protein F443_16403 [Phytophthora nicotianae P1569]ETM37722.1 hypothetical protein L914_15771 [Phytophthora nicotianae]ETO66458.1 hypothetical protein F444_16372 [Phytophthora nicotianae P1976]